ncbi:hypothetical protein GUJ93_ZPchr0004g38962 [Zizania palustris]|uniref:Uncharacterized protein n=1 Tax=Zizania palustris TaxID=103762 RepID=A0A8J5VGA5_ZIZPA|nr:hypothetical protein GUJ93_ZPchr0004g38962 [Zizania palustris]
MAVLEGFPIAHTVGFASAHADDLVQAVAPPRTAGALRADGQSRQAVALRGRCVRHAGALRADADAAWAARGLLARCARMRTETADAQAALY